MTNNINEFIKQNKDFFIFNISNEAKEEISTNCINNILNNDIKQDEILVEALECTKILARDLSLEIYLCKEDVWKKLLEISEISLYSEQENNISLISQHSPVIIEYALKVLCNMTKNFHYTIPADLKPIVVSGILNRTQLYGKGFPEITIDIKIFETKLFFLYTALFRELRFLAIQDHDCLQHFSAVFRWGVDSVTALNSDDVTLCCEITKCLFNVLYISMDDNLEQKVEKEMPSLLNSLKELVVAIHGHPSIPGVSKIEMLSNTSNLLTSVPDCCFQYLLFESNQESEDNLYKDVQSLRFIQLILDLIEIRLNENVNLLESLSPLMHAMGKACLADRNIRKYSRLKVLPYMRKEVMELPEQGNSTRNKLCKLLQHPCEQVTESVAFFLFVLCKEDVERAIKYTGFGNFAGFLARHALLTSSKNQDDGSYSDSEDSETEEYLNVRDKVNPVTGRVEEAQANPLEGMTEEQKEYEVVRLMNQIDMLQKQGIIKPGIIGDDGSVRPAECVLEIMEKAAEANNYKEKSGIDSDNSD